jgi:hypothetical protein
MKFSVAANFEQKSGQTSFIDTIFKYFALARSGLGMLTWNVYLTP